MAECSFINMLSTMSYNQHFAHLLLDSLDFDEIKEIYEDSKASVRTEIINLIWIIAKTCSVAADFLHNEIIAGKAGSLKGPGNGGKYDGINPNIPIQYDPCQAENGEKFSGGNSCATALGSSGGGGGGYYGGGGGADLAGWGGGSGYISSLLIFGKTGTSSHIGNGEISIIPKFNFGSCRETRVYHFSLFTSVIIFCNLK